MRRHKPFKAWTLIVLCSAFLLVGAVVLVNIIVDPYGILRTDFSRQFQVPNLNYIKMKHVIENKTKYDSFIFGSSRIETIDPKKISNGNYYNMTYPLGLPGEHLMNIRYMLDQGINIKNIIIGLEEFSYLIDPLPRSSDLLYQPHPAVSGKKASIFYGEYFFRVNKIFRQFTAYIEHNYAGKDAGHVSRVKYDVAGTGRIILSELDEKIDRDMESHIQNSNFSDVIFDYDGDYIDQTLAVVKQLVALCRSRGISLTFFINPMHKAAYLKTDLDKMARFKEGLAGICDYFDFSGINTITKNNYYYYETIHYRPLVGNMILKVMFGNPVIPVPADFGFLVTKNNIDRHLARLCRELNAVRSDIKKQAVTFPDSCSEMNRLEKSPHVQLRREEEKASLGSILYEKVG